jgi:hypothetical protein
VGVEKLFSGSSTTEIRSQVIESSFAVGAEIHRNYSFGSFFNSHACFRQHPSGKLISERGATQLLFLGS